LGQFDDAEATLQSIRRKSPLLSMEYADIAMAHQDWPEVNLAEFARVD
jgi:hypothetical protein